MNFKKIRSCSRKSETQRREEEQVSRDGHRLDQIAWTVRVCNSLKCFPETDKLLHAAAPLVLGFLQPSVLTSLNQEKLLDDILGG